MMLCTGSRLCRTAIMPEPVLFMDTDRHRRIVEKDKTVMNESEFCRGYETGGARLVTLRNKAGAEASFTNYGARWVDMALPCGKGRTVQVVLGFDTLEGYGKAGEQYHGAIVGRVCGRISGASFSLDGTVYSLDRNDAYGEPVKNHLHGGMKALHNRFWDVLSVDTSDSGQSVTFVTFSPAGEGGYPGNLRTGVKYTLLPDKNVIVMECMADTDRATVVNLTNHTFFNLSGHSPGMNVGRHELHVFSGRVIECDSELIPTGRLIDDRDCFADFSNGKTIRDAIDSGGPQVMSDGGFTAGYAFPDRYPGDGGIRHVCRLEDRESGRALDMYSDRPSLQVYNGYFMDGSDTGHNGIPYYPNSGLALEPQDYPDAPNRPEFPSVVITPGRPYRQRTEYRFSDI